MDIFGQQIDFQPMTIADLEEVMSVENTNYSFPWPRQNFKDCLRSNYQCWLMKVGQKLAGYSVLSKKGDLAHLLNLSIHRDYQSKGFGRQFLQFMLRQAQTLNALEVYLEVRVTNTRARQLYVSEGFNEVGKSKDYYPAKKAREDAVVLAFNL
jgi:ribosomal-protein-alanine N-acetyltransferase